MQRFLARLTPVGGDVFVVEQLARPTDPGFGGGRPAGGDPDYGIPGGGWSPTDPGFGGGRPGGADPGYGHPGGGYRPGNALPIAPVRPSVPIVLPPGMWPPTLPPGIDNTLPGVPPDTPIFIPPGSIDNELPIHLPHLPPGTALLIALPARPPGAQPKGDAPVPPPNTKPAILWQGVGTKPVLVFVSVAPAAPAAPAPK